MKKLAWKKIKYSSKIQKKMDVKSSKFTFPVMCYLLCVFFSIHSVLKKESPNESENYAKKLMLSCWKCTENLPFYWESLGCSWQICILVALGHVSSERVVFLHIPWEIINLINWFLKYFSKLLDKDLYIITRIPIQSNLIIIGGFFVKKWQVTMWGN